MRLVPIREIHVPDNRQRTTIEYIEGLARSIEENTAFLKETQGLIHPIVLRHGNTLVVGGRRLAALKSLGREFAAANDIEDLSEIDAQIIELEENVKRRDIPWQDQYKAIIAIHEMLSGRSPEWTQQETAHRIGISPQKLSQYLAVSTAVAADPDVMNASTFEAAFNMHMRQRERSLDDMLTGIQEHVMLTGKVHLPDIPPAEESPSNGHDTVPAVARPALPKLKPASESIICGDFLQWSRSYSGPFFNFIHCDFPYAAGAGRADSQINVGGDHVLYEDNEDIFWALCQGLLDSMHNVIAPSAHIVLWYQSGRLPDVLDFFTPYAKQYDLRIFRTPLIWFKSDGSGVMADPARRPRHVYESALMVSRGDRSIVKPIADVYACGISRQIHPSEKPESMLHHFFQMFVSKTTRMLDPTCGSGTSLRAAERLDADFTLGFEINPKFASEAIRELDLGRRKIYLSKQLNLENLNDDATQS